MHPTRLRALVFAIAASIVPVIHVLFLHFSFNSLQNQINEMPVVPMPIPCMHANTFARVAHVERLSQFYALKTNGPSNLTSTLTVDNVKKLGVPAPTNGITVYFCVIVFTWYLFLAYLITTTEPKPTDYNDDYEATTTTTDSSRKSFDKMKLLYVFAMLQTIFLLANVVIGILASFETREGYFTPDTPTLSEDPTAKDLDVAYIVQEIVYFLFGLNLAVGMWRYVTLAKRNPNAIVKYRRRRLLPVSESSKRSTTTGTEKDDDEPQMEKLLNYTSSSSPMISKGTSGYLPDSILLDKPEESRPPNLGVDEFNSLLNTSSSPVVDVESGPVYNPRSMLIDPKPILPASEFDPRTASYIAPKPKLEVTQPKSILKSPNMQPLEYPQPPLKSPVLQQLDFPRPQIASPSLKPAEYPQPQMISPKLRNTEYPQPNYRLSSAATPSLPKPPQQNPQTLDRKGPQPTGQITINPQEQDKPKTAFQHRHRLSDVSLDPSEVVAHSVSTDYKYTPFSVGAASVVSEEEFNDNESVGVK